MTGSGDAGSAFYNLKEETDAEKLLQCVENPSALTPIRHTNLALNNAGVRGSTLVDFPVKSQ